MPLFVDGGGSAAGGRFNQLCQDQGWSNATLLDMAMDHMAREGVFESFVESLEERAAEEREATELFEEDTV